MCWRFFAAALWASAFLNLFLLVSARAREGSPESLYPCGFPAFFSNLQLRLFSGYLRLFSGLCVFFPVASTYASKNILTQLRKYAMIAPCRKTRKGDAIGDN